MVYEQDTLKHTKGDTGGIKITSILLEDGTEYTLQDGDTITLTVRSKPADDSPILLQIVSKTNELILKPEDTANIAPGKYSADIQLDTVTGDRFTIWPDKSARAMTPTAANFSNFWIWPEVT